jgi:hypothetical protein
VTPPGWICTKRIGFLFPRTCSRTTPVGCEDCNNGQLTDPYRFRYHRYGYDDYDDYGSDWTGAMIGFTEADGEKLVKPTDGFEDDMSAS